MEEGEVLLRDEDRLSLVADAHVHDAVLRLDVDGPDLFGPEGAEAATLDHRRAAHADGAVLRRDDDVAAAEQRGVSREATPRGDAHRGHEAGERREAEEARRVEAGNGRHVDVVGAPASAFREEHHRHPPLRGEREHPIELLVAHPALGAGEDRVVVREHDGPRMRVVERVAIHGSDAAYDAVGRADSHELVDRVSLPLRSERERAVLDEAAFVEEVLDVLARRPLAGLAPARDGVGPLDVRGRAHALAKLG